MRNTLILKLENLPKTDDGSGNLVETKLTLYWNEDTKEWGPPNQKHHWFDDIETDGATGQPVDPNNITPSAAYNARYAKFNKNDLCDSNFPVNSLIQPFHLSTQPLISLRIQLVF